MPLNVTALLPLVYQSLADPEETGDRWLLLVSNVRPQQPLLVRVFL